MTLLLVASAFATSPCDPPVATVPRDEMVDFPTNAHALLVKGSGCGALQGISLVRNDRWEVDTPDVSGVEIGVVDLGALQADSTYDLDVWTTEGGDAWFEFETGSATIEAIDATAPTIEAHCSWYLDGSVSCGDIVATAGADAYGTVALEFAWDVGGAFEYGVADAGEGWMVDGVRADSAPEEVCFVATQYDVLGGVTSGAEQCYRSECGCASTWSPSGAAAALAALALLSRARGNCRCSSR